MSQKYECIAALDPRIIAYIQAWIGSTKIFIVSKIRCKLCKRAKKLLREVAGSSVTPIVFEVDKYPYRWSQVFLKYLSAQSKVRTVPLIWIHGKYIGGFEDVLRLHQEGRLVYLFEIKTWGLKNFKKHRISTTYIPTKRRLSMKTKAPLLQSRVKQHVEKTPIVRIRRNDSGCTSKDNKGVNKGTSKSYFLRRNSISYRPLTFSVDDDINTPIRNTKTSRQRAQSMGDIGICRKSSRSIARSKRWRVRMSTQTTVAAQAEEAKISEDRATRHMLLITRISSGPKISRGSGWI